MASFSKYFNFVLGQIQGTHAVDFDNHELRIALVAPTYTPNAATHEYWSDVQPNEVTGGGYTAGGAVLGGLSVTMDGAGVVTFKAASPTWLQSNTGFTNARYAVLYRWSGVAGTSPLVAFMDLTRNFGNDTGDFKITLNSTSGVFQFA